MSLTSVISLQPTNLYDYFAIKKFELTYFFKLRKLNNENGKNFYLYEFTEQKRKHKNVSKITYNTMTTNYEFEGKRFLNFNDLMTHIYNTRSIF